MYFIRLTEPAIRDLNKLPAAVAAAVIEFLAGDLASNPHRVGKPLRGDHEGLYSARRGTYRIIYQIFETHVVVEVVRIRHRSNAYRPN